ncbi:hypothetical protein AAFA46_05645 [Oscillospiraceae bacterium WX1]
MSIPKKTVKLLLICAGVLLLLASYFFVYLNFSGKTEELNAENDTLKKQLNTLNGYNSQQAVLKTKLDNDKADVDALLSHYYSMEQPEDFIMLASNMDNYLGVKVTALSFDEPAVVTKLAGVADTTYNTLPVTKKELTAYVLSSTVSASMNYSQLKNLLKSIYMQKDKTTLDSLTLNFDSSSGLILGTLKLNKYYITGRGIDDHKIDIPYNNIGKSVLMGS